MPERYDLMGRVYCIPTGDRLTAYRANEEIGDQLPLVEIGVSS
jgi:hypothetical protein